ncbi:MAG: helix-turn-helix domain-containing protein [Pseudonocardiaceae bacterium]|nr:helix-turn-helix domain-containing protein [Pseudonocardiaceae bacterium]
MARASSEDVIVLGQRRRGRLEAIVARATAPQHLVLRAKIVVAAWRREANAKIASDLGICVDTVRKWRGRFRREGIPGLFDRARSGRPPVYGIEDQLLIVATVTQEMPETDSHWTHRALAEHLREPLGYLRLPDRADPGLVGPQTPSGPWLAQPARRPAVPHQGPGRVPPLLGPARRHGGSTTGPRTPPSRPGRGSASTRARPGPGR